MQGSVEAIVGALDKLGTDEVARASSTRASAASPKSDVKLAEASGAVVIGFNVRANAQAATLADRRASKSATTRSSTTWWTT